jgi:large subunit ribosomal protein L24
MKIKKGDQIIVTQGKDNGRKGKVTVVDSVNQTVTVPGVNMYKRHEKKRDEKRPGGIVEYARPLAMGKVALLCPKCGKQTRVGFLVTKNSKERICRKCEQKI